MEKEGFVGYVYLDEANNPTIGKGHLVTADDLQYKLHMSEDEANKWLEDVKKTASDLKQLKANHASQDKLKAKEKELKDLMAKVAAWTMTEEEAKAQFEKDLAEIANKVDADTKGMGFTDDQFGALVSWAYNFSPGRLKGSSLYTRLKEAAEEAKEKNLTDAQRQELYKNIAREEFPKWVKADGKVSKGLEIRRDKELKLFLGELQKSPAQQPPNQAAGPNRQPAITKQASYDGAYQESLLEQFARNPDSQSLPQ